MRVFVSSVIKGFEEFRDAAASAIRTLGHVPVLAEELGASPDSPQQACLGGVRDADSFVLVLGDRYGHPQASGLSATHEEYREARDTRPVLVFLRRNVEPEPLQLSFINEVRSWEQGHLTADFGDPSDLRDKVTRELHDYELANEAAPLDESELATRAHALIPTGQSSLGSSLVLAVAGGPGRAVLRPAELENEDLQRFLLAEALTGVDAVLSPSIGTDVAIRGDTMQISQAQRSAVVTLDEGGNLVVVQPALEPDSGRSGIPSLIEEVVTERITRAIRFCAGVLNHVDPAQRMSHIAPVVGLRGGGHMPWRTQAEQDRSPNRAAMGVGGSEQVVIALSPPVRRRAALLQDTQRLAEDFTVRLRREVRQ